MKKIILTAFALGCMAMSSFAQLIDEKNVTVTMELVPVLQLDMTTPDQVDFTFDQIAKYQGGIIKYGATVLKISSSVSWDLYACGTSQNGTTWDQQSIFGLNGTNVLPIEALELHQSVTNTATGQTGVFTDYSSTFIPAGTAVLTGAAGNAGTNSIWASATPYTAPTAVDKYILGSVGTGLNVSVDGGTYLEQAGSTTSNYYVTIDYRILPGLPATFPFAGHNYSYSFLIPLK